MKRFWRRRKVTPWDDLTKRPEPTEFTVQVRNSQGSGEFSGQRFRVQWGPVFGLVEHQSSIRLDSDGRWKISVDAINRAAGGLCSTCGETLAPGEFRWIRASTDGRGSQYCSERCMSGRTAGRVIRWTRSQTS